MKSGMPPHIFVFLTKSSLDRRNESLNWDEIIDSIADKYA